MLKFNYAINLGLALVLGVPAVTLGVQANEPLETTLARTVHALERLAGIEKRLQEKDATAVADALRASEPALPVPAADPGARDRMLESANEEIALLQRRVDSLELDGVDVPHHRPATTMPGDSERTAASSGTERVSTGLDDAELRALLNAAAQRRARAAATVPAAPIAAPTASDKTTFEHAGYTADALKLGRALYRLGRFDEARANFDSLGDQPEARYWRARSLERLQKTAEASEAYTQLIARTDAGAFAERARADLELLRWRIELDRPAPATGEKQP